jgi:hypothetical protein
VSPRRLGAAALGALAVTGCGSGANQHAGPGTPREHGQRRPLLPVAPALRVAATGAVAPLALRTGSGAQLGARLRGPVLLRVSPGGQALALLRSRTEFGSPRILAVVRRLPGWLGVVSAQRPNNHIGWISARRAELVGESVRLLVDLSQRRLTVLRGGREILRMPVAVGGPATPTPTGRFEVTDGLYTNGGAYGCCILALSAHQSHIAQGWTGGDRIAIHGTLDQSSVRRAVSHGCLRAHDADLRRLLRVATLGAEVRIRR